MSTRAGHVQLFSNFASAPIRWRLLSGNNRDIGRGVKDFADAETCRVGIKELQTNLHELRSRLVRAQDSAWSWQLLDGDVAVVLASAHFDRQIRCEQALDGFRSMLEHASISEDVMISSKRRRPAVGGAVDGPVRPLFTDGLPIGRRRPLSFGHAIGPFAS
jgi:hypothetical protein